MNQAPTLPTTLLTFSERQTASNVATCAGRVDGAASGSERLHQWLASVEGIVATTEPVEDEPSLESGKFCMDVMTVARALQDGMPIGAETSYVCVLRADSGKNIVVALSSMESVRAFIKDFRPCVVVARVGDGEDVENIAYELSRRNEDMAEDSRIDD